MTRPRSSPTLPVGGHRPDTNLGRIDVLLLCTGNICRSPMAEAFLRDRLSQRGVDAHVHSAGLLEAGRAVSDHAVAVVRGRGLDIGAHRSRSMERDLLHGADLILGMAREHVREAVVRVPDVWPRAFTLKELVRRAVQTGPRPEGQSFEEWLSKCHAGRVHTDLLGASRADDVADPYGSSRQNYERTAVELHDLIERLVDLAFPADSPGARPS